MSQNGDFDISKYVHGRVAVFIDASNIYHSQKTLGWKVDFEKLHKYFWSELQLVLAHYYTGLDPQNKGQVRFFKHLVKFGYAVISKELKIIKIGKDSHRHKGSLDIELALDCYILKDKFDTLVLLSGDSDFAPLLDKLKEGRKRIIIVSTRGHVAVELLERGKFVELDKIRRFIEYKSQETPKGL